MAMTDHDRPDSYEAAKTIAQELITAFGDRAVQVAQRQLEMAAEPASITTWQALVDIVTASNDGVLE